MRCTLDVQPSRASQQLACLCPEGGVGPQRTSLSHHVWRPPAQAARALKKLGGRSAYVLNGGFEAWRDRGLLTSSSFTIGGFDGLIEDAKETYTEAATLTQSTLSEVVEQGWKSLFAADEVVRSVTAVPVVPGTGAAAASSAEEGAGASPPPVLKDR